MSSTPALARPSTHQLWSQFADGLRAFIAARVPAEAVDDIQQDVFLRIHRSLSGGVVPNHPRGWAYQIARNAVVDHHRKRAGDRLTLHPNPEELPVAIVQEDAAIGAEELGRCLRPFIDALPAPYRQAMLLTEFEGKTQVAAAAEVGLSVSGMKSRVQRARAMLAGALLGCCDMQFDVYGTVADCDC